MSDSNPRPILVPKLRLGTQTWRQRFPSSECRSRAEPGDESNNESIKSRNANGGRRDMSRRPPSLTRNSYFAFPLTSSSTNPVASYTLRSASTMPAECTDTAREMMSS